MGIIISVDKNKLIRMIRVLPLALTVFHANPLFANSEYCKNLDFKVNLTRYSQFEINNWNNEDLLIDSKSMLKINKLNASWELSRLGSGEILAQLHNKENALYYIMTALMAKENILLDGQGGGAKTFLLRKIYEAQLHAVNLIDPANIPEKLRENFEFKKALIEIIQNDFKETDPKKKLFTQQFHATLSETKVLGGPNPFKYINDGKYEIDYSKALIHESNIFAILDELEKAPISLQMTLLSILNERQALAGNSIVQTMLESVAATTNATLGGLISEAESYEVGGRQALIDRFPIKMHIVNVSASSMDAYLLVEKMERSKGENKFVIIDLRGLRPLVDNVLIPAELLKAMTDISLHLDRKYTEFLTAAQAEVAGTDMAPSFYPPFSGSTRVQTKVPRIWESAFLVRQLLAGVPFEQIRLTMEPKDLIDLAPALLQGGADLFVPKKGMALHFVQAADINETGYSVNKIILASNNSTNGRLFKYNISIGYYDPHTQIFEYQSANTGEVRQVYFDVKNKKLLTTDKIIQDEIILRQNDLEFSAGHAFTKKHIDLVGTLTKIHESANKNRRFQKSNPVPEFKVTGKNAELISNGPLRFEPKKQLEEIAFFHQEFLDYVNFKIKLLSGQQMTPIDPSRIYAEINQFHEEAQALNNKIGKAIEQKDEKAILKLSIESVRQAFKELSYLFIGASSTLKAEFVAIINEKNLMVFGPPGSAKTMLSRMILGRVVDGIAELQIGEINKFLSQQLQKVKVGADSIYVKQFHPMSTEGDIVGRVDLAALRRGEGYTHNREGSLSGKNIMFALLDEIEKAPPGVRTALLSLLNERELFDGDTVVKTALSAVILSTNQTPTEFLIGQGAFSSAFAIMDRNHGLAYASNKLSPTELEEIHLRTYLKIPMQLRSPLMLHPLVHLKEKIKFTPTERKLLTDIGFEMTKICVDLSEAHRALYRSDRENNPSFYFNSRGESERSTGSVNLAELPGSILLNRILNGESVEDIIDKDYEFDLDDLVGFANLYLTYNNMYQIEKSENSQGLISFVVKEKSNSLVEDRIDNREKTTYQNFKWEAEQLAGILERNATAYLRGQAAMIAAHPNLYPSAFASKEIRIQWLKNAGFTDEQITKSLD